MIKPLCSDFCITEEDLSAYEWQEAKVSAANRRNARLFHVVIWIAAAVFYAAGVAIAVLYREDGASAYAGGVIFFIGATVCLVIAVLNIKGRVPDPVMRRKPVYYDRELARRCEPYIEARNEYADYVRGVNVAYWEGFSAEEFVGHVAKLLKRDGYAADPSFRPDEVSPFPCPDFAVCAYTILSLDGASVLVQCVKSPDGVTASDMEKFTDSVSVCRVPIKRVIYISVRGYAFDKYGGTAKSLKKRAEKKRIATELWDMDDVLTLAYECGVLNFS